MKTAQIFKMPFQTNLFNKNQTVFIQIKSGQLAVQVKGKYRGKGRYISAWVNYEKAEKNNLLMPKIIEIQVPDSFALKHKLFTK